VVSRAKWGRLLLYSTETLRAHNKSEASEQMVSHDRIKNNDTSRWVSCYSCRRNKIPEMFVCLCLFPGNVLWW
jgi:hypothetical protein